MVMIMIIIVMSHKRGNVTRVSNGGFLIRNGKIAITSTHTIITAFFSNVHETGGLFVNSGVCVCVCVCVLACLGSM